MLQCCICYSVAYATILLMLQRCLCYSITYSTALTMLQHYLCYNVVLPPVPEIDGYLIGWNLLPPELETKVFFIGWNLLPPFDIVFHCCHPVATIGWFLPMLQRVCCHLSQNRQKHYY